MVEFGLIVFFLLLFILLCFMGMVRSIKCMRIIMDTPTSKIRSAAQGYVELKGKAKPIIDPILAPLSNKPCCWYHYKIEKEVSTTDSDGYPKTEWRTVARETSPHFFHVIDGTGSVVICPAGADASIKVKETWYNTSVKKRKGSLGSALLNSVISSAACGRLRYYEERIEPDQKVVALGFFRTLSKNETPFELDEVKKHVEAEAVKRKKVSTFRSLGNLADTLKQEFTHKVDGIKEEWEAAVKKDKYGKCHVLHKKERPFIITTFSEKKIIKRYFWQSVICSTLFVGLVVVLYFVVRHGPWNS